MKSIWLTGLALALTGMVWTPAGAEVAGDGAAAAAAAEILFDGSSLDAWEFTPGSWEVDEEGALTCRLGERTLPDGTVKVAGMGNIWSRETYGNFDLTLSYKLSEGANSGVFYRANPENPVQDGLEVQLMDNEGFQKIHGVKDPRKLNGSFYDGKAPSSDLSGPPGSWNTLRLRCEGPRIRISINGEEVIDVDIDDWDEAGVNPDGTSNKFKRPLREFPREGRLGFQNHGQVVWFRDVTVRRLP